ncbi:MAG: DNA repair protein RecN [Eggerthellaceae bacterium]|jgi:DNA repair protein RecN (Recombination protein N)|nr:DNA repair protein RecN [Eggerthellaceae bacterium]MDR2715231.1 DNA repair protein RecN [Coriobacteriaceae bacterium]
MIDEIRVKNVALIRDAALMPARGLTVLTGETGAGKTALLSACKLLCGERADATAVREGEADLVVEGRFFSAGGEDRVVSRRVSADGRSRVSINGAMASVGELQGAIGPLVDLCGQHEHQRLLKTSTHVGLLDAWAGAELASALEAYRLAFGQAEAAAAELRRIQDAGSASAAKLDEARFVLNRIDAVNPQEGEYEELVATLSKAEHAEALAVVSETAHTALSGEGGAIDAVHRAAAALDGAPAVDAKFGELAATLREAGFLLEDVSREARSYRDAIEFDPQVLEANQERVAAFQGLLRSFGPRMADVLEKREEAASLIALMDDSEERLRTAQAALDEAEETLLAAADALDDARRLAAPRFADEVNEQLAGLEMAGASIVCSTERLERGQWTKVGPSQVEFLFQPAEAMQARPLARIASGGEVSRVMLAIKVVLGRADEVETLIFDEIDAGVGGATGLALAKVLTDLAATHQVIVVTHLAQIAVAGQAHYRVVKREAAADAIPETDLVALADDDRVHEIARMLSGDASGTSLEHAKEMLAKAHG